MLRNLLEVVKAVRLLLSLSKHRISGESLAKMIYAQQGSGAFPCPPRPQGSGLRRNLR